MGFCAQYVLFSTFFDAGLDDTNATVIPNGPMGPGSFKFPEIVREALAPSLRSLLEWRHLPSERAVNGEHGDSTIDAKL